MSSTNITEGNKILSTTSEGQIPQPSTHENSSEQQATSTGFKTQFNVRITAVQDTEEPVTHTKSLSSLDELATRIKEQFNEKDLERAVCIQIENTGPPTTFENSKSLNELSERIKNLQNKEGSCSLTNNITHTSIDMAGASGSAPSGSNSICSIDLLVNRNEAVEDKDSFITVEACQKEKMTSTDITTTFSPNYRTQNILVARNDYHTRAPPPPYEYSERPQAPVYQGTVRQTPVYMQTTSYDMGMPRDASQAPPYRRSSGSDPENLFNTKAIRNKFVQKVYAILSVQLFFTFGAISYCIFEKNARKFVITQWPLLIGIAVVYMVLLITLFCYKSTRRIFPLNFILLSLLTFCMAYISAALSCMYETHIVLTTMGVTAVICTLVSLLACQHWFDVTKYGMIICLASIIIFLYGMIAIVIYMVTGSSIVYLIYACLVTLLFCVYLMYDTQQVLGGRRIELSPEEYILGALTLYVDIMIIFQKLLIIISHIQS